LGEVEIMLNYKDETDFDTIKGRLKSDSLNEKIMNGYNSSESTNLKNLFNENGTDKATIHNYHFLYDSLFRVHKDNKINVLEIGVYEGGSLKTWKEYFKLANIIGIDIDPETIFSDDRIQTFVSDQNSQDYLRQTAHNINRNFDVVIDDGWHQPEAAVNTLVTFLPRLNIGGFYVIEDLNLMHYQLFYTELAKLISSKKNFAAAVIDIDALFQVKSLKGSVVLLAHRLPN